MEKPNLLWETIRYFPRILFTIEPINTGLRRSLSYEVSHFHYFLESEFGFTNVRDSDFKHCKSLLQSQLADPGLLFYIAFGKRLNVFNCFLNAVQAEANDVRQLVNIYNRYDRPQF